MTSAYRTYRHFPLKDALPATTCGAASARSSRVERSYGSLRMELRINHADGIITIADANTTIGYCRYDECGAIEYLSSARRFGGVAMRGGCSPSSRSAWARRSTSSRH